MNPRGLNDGCYRGDRIDIESVLTDCLAAAEAHGWTVRWLETTSPLRLLTLHRAPTNPRRHLYLSSGIHGDEPAAPLAMLQLLEENNWPEDTELWLSPCLNPTGFPINSRESASGEDLNRDYKHRRTPEIAAHVAWLETLPDFEFTIQLHEDWEAQGFYFYELKMDGTPTEPRRVLEAVSAVCPIDHSPEIDGRNNDSGLIKPELDPAVRELWPEAFWLVMNKTRLSYTCEAPSDFEMAVRVEALVTAVRALLTTEAQSAQS
ncbi:MAG: M14 family metallocarboxypeptidase [Verrucomicrobia subdivision 3 bacterium]|nr:M14 family metallocarboxypeptidase [Limisphaerales bacterium]